MHQQRGTESTAHPVIDALEGTSCSFCETGELVRERYKGNTAVVCESCATPGAQLW